MTLQDLRTTTVVVVCIYLKTSLSLKKTIYVFHYIYSDISYKMRHKFANYYDVTHIQCTRVKVLVRWEVPISLQHKNRTLSPQIFSILSAKRADLCE